MLESVRIVVATSNSGKLREFSDAARSTEFLVEALPTIKSLPAPAETGSTFEENARIKAATYSNHMGSELVIADDSGLEVHALGGAPGVHSARYAAKNPAHKPSDSDNNYKLLTELRILGDVDRTARFVCVIAVARDGEILGTFRGEARGEILMAPVGRHGFGYDPLFYVADANKTFAEMSEEEKLRYSHRGAAFRNFLNWWKKQVELT
jgi:XTP/dITP diphosphohydrolase